MMGKHIPTGARMPTLLMAEDDPDDRLLALDALRSAQIGARVEMVPDGQSLLDYLYRRPPYDDRERYPSPSLVLLDLNMPRVGGHAALTAIRAESSLRHLPVIVLTTSSSPEEVLRCYQAGCNAYIRKPSSFAQLVTVIRATVGYWTQTVELPRSTS